MNNVNPTKVVVVSSGGEVNVSGGNIRLLKIKEILEKRQKAKLTYYFLRKFETFDLKSVVKATIVGAFYKIPIFEYLRDSDLIISNSPFPNDLFLSIRLSRILDKPLAVYFHHITPPFDKNVFKRGLLHTVLSRFWTIVAILILSKLRVPIFLNCTDKSRINTTEVLYIKSCPITIPPVISSQNEPVFDLCFISSLTRNKGVLDVLKVVTIIKKWGIPIKVLIAGRGKDKFVRKIMRIIAKRGLSENIELKGTVDEKTKYESILLSRAFIFPSYEEGWGLAVHEVALLGRPLILYALDAYDYLEGNYLSSMTGNTKEMARNVLKVIEAPNEMKEMVMRAKIIASRYNYDVISAEDIEYYHKIISSYRHK